MKDKVLNEVRLIAGFKSYENQALNNGYINNDEDLIRIISDFFSFEMNSWQDIADHISMLTGEDLNHQSKDSISFIDKNTNKDNLLSCICEIESMIESYGCDSAALVMAAVVQNLIVVELPKSSKGQVIADIVEQINIGDREIMKHIMF